MTASAVRGAVRADRTGRRQAGAQLRRRRQQFLDLAGDGQLDLVELRRPDARLLTSATEDEGWEPFHAVRRRCPTATGDDPNLRSSTSTATASPTS